MRESGEELVGGAGDRARHCGCSTSAAATGRRRCPRPGSAPTSSASTSPPTSSPPATRAAAAAGLGNLRFQEGDASDLADLTDDSFDLVVSIFGAMFAPRPFDVAKEMVRVARPGGRIVMGNWIPGDPTLVAQILKISGAYSPPPPEGFVSPVTWGVENDVLERFAAAGIAPERVSTERATWTFVHPGAAGRAARRIPRLLRPDDERLRRRRGRRPRRRAAGRARRRCSSARTSPPTARPGSRRRTCASPSRLDRDLRLAGGAEGV